MPKSVMIDPKTARSRAQITFQPIPVNSYDRSIKDELAEGRFSKADLLRIQFDMMLIRAFESMLDSVKKQGNYQGIEYNHRGRPTCPLGRKPRPWARCICSPWMTTSTARTAATEKSWPRVCPPSPSSIMRDCTPS